MSWWSWWERIVEEERSLQQWLFPSSLVEVREEEQRHHITRKSVRQKKITPRQCPPPVAAYSEVECSTLGWWFEGWGGKTAAPSIIQSERRQFREQVKLQEDSRGHSYKRLFSKYLDSTVSLVEVDDPYIRATHQCDNFLRFVELLVNKCPNLTTIRLKTGLDSDQESQKQRLEAIVKSLRELPDRKVMLLLNFSDSLHDREIRLSNGWVIKIGRGLDYFKPVDRFNVGFTDFDLRPCKETTIDIFQYK